MDRVRDAEPRVRRIACTGCGSTGVLQTVIRCELASGDRYLVRCQRCGIFFELSTEVESGELLQPASRTWLCHLDCPACKALGGDVAFRCDVPGRPSFYLVRCRTCGHEYAEAPALSGEGRGHAP